MASHVYNCYTGDDITESMLEAAATFFSQNYGIWDKRSGIKGRVKLSASRLRNDYLPDSATIVYANVIIDGTLAGNAFACRWDCGDKKVCWVTQLVVAKEFRERGLATGLLRILRHDTDTIYGIMSSHPAARMAAAKAFGSYIGNLNLDFMQQEEASIMKVSPIPYIKAAKLSGRLFVEDEPRGLVAGADTNFFVDHTEPLKALQYVKEFYSWPLGDDLPHGHEFLLLPEGQRWGSRYHSSSRPSDGSAPGAGRVI